MKNIILDDREVELVSEILRSKQAQIHSLRNNQPAARYERRFTDFRNQLTTKILTIAGVLEKLN